MADDEQNQADRQGLVTGRHVGIQPVEIRDEIQNAYLDYAMSVIVGRALPDVRDGLKPVHRRVIYAMYDGGYRPDRGWNKCSRVVGDVMGKYHPHGDSAIYDTLVRLAQPWAMRYKLVQGQGNFGSQGNDGAAAMRYTECKMASLAMEMVRDIDQDTVDFQPNYDNKETEPVVLPSRFPNLLVNGSSGIAVGMATNIPTHNLREVNEAVQWSLAHPEASEEELLEACLERIKGPDFPGGALIVGRQGIEDAYRTGRGSVTMRAVIDMEEDKKGRQCLVVTELPYMCNPDNLATKIADLVNSGRINGIADISYWIDHQMEVIRRRTEYRLAQAEKDAHIQRALVKALDMLDEVIALIRRSPNTEAASTGLQELLDIDEIQARAILDMQLRRLAALERQKIIDRLEELERLIAEYKAILASEDRQREIISTELAEIVDKYGDERRTRIIAADGDFSEEDFIPDDGVVVTITRGGYAKRTRTDLYRVQKRGGKGVRGASLRADDEVAQLFTTTNHQWILFFTNMGRVYRTKVWQLPEAGRDAKGGHVAGLLSFLPDEKIAQVMTLRSYEDAEYLLLATRKGMVKKTALKAYDSSRQAGVIAINFRTDDDELIGAEQCSAADDVLLISRKGQAIRFSAGDDQLRAMGRATSGVTGMKFRDDDELLSMSIIHSDMPEDDRFVFTATDGGYAKRSAVSQYRQQGRGGLGIKAMALNEERGSLVGGLVVSEADEIIAIKSSGQITRSAVSEVPAKGRSTMGVKFVSVRGGDAVSIIALNPEQAVDEDVSEEPVENVEGDAAHSEPGDVLLQSDIVDGDRAVDTAESEMEPEDNGE